MLYRGMPGITVLPDPTTAICKAPDIIDELTDMFLEPREMVPECVAMIGRRRQKSALRVDIPKQTADKPLNEGLAAKAQKKAFQPLEPAVSEEWCPVRQARLVEVHDAVRVYKEAVFKWQSMDFSMTGEDLLEQIRATATGAADENDA